MLYVVLFWAKWTSEFGGDQLEMVSIGQKQEETNIHDVLIDISSW